MPRALCTIRDLPHYRREAFVSGLEARGFEVCAGIDKPRPDDVCITWNRYGRFEAEAKKFERAGAKVIVAENGYCGADELGRQYYALALGNHLGAGRWPDGDGSRWVGFGIDLKPWRERDDGYVLLCPSRGIGPPGIAQPASWTQRATEAIKRHTGREIRCREHPGARNPNGLPPFEEDLEGAFCVVVWASRCGVDAVISGVPVFHGLDRWILGSVASMDLSRIESPRKPDRLKALERMAWAQWSVDEIASGEPFRCLLSL